MGRYNIMIRIPAKKFSNLIMIDMFFWNLNSQKYSKALIAVDTGAITTVISSEVLHKLGYDLTTFKIEKIRTASKIEEVGYGKLQKLKLGDIEINDIEIYSYEFPEDTFYADGLLGLNVLTKFDVNFLFSQNILEFTPRKDI